MSERDRTDQQEQTALTPPVADAPAGAAPISPVASHVLGLQRAAGNAAVTQYLQGAGLLSSPGDAQEREADSVAREVMNPAGAVPSIARATAPAPSGQVDVSGLGSGQPLARAVRDFMEPRFGTDFSDVRVHTDDAAAHASAALGAEAFTYGSDVYYGAGKAPATDELTAHELSHVVQQRGRCRPPSDPAQPDRQPPGDERRLRDRHADARGRRQHAPDPQRLRRLHPLRPNVDAPNSNKIVFVQIVKLTDPGGADVDPASMPAAQAPRGALGDPGVRTEDNADARGRGRVLHRRPPPAATGLSGRRTGLAAVPELQLPARGARHDRRRRPDAAARAVRRRDRRRRRPDARVQALQRRRGHPLRRALRHARHRERRPGPELRLRVGRRAARTR